MYNSDLAINGKSEDLLGRSGFASELAKAILTTKTKNSMVIGLYGTWGSGKTSLVNMVIESINEDTKNDIQKPLIVNFSPWMFSDQDNLIASYFKTLRLCLNIEKNNYWKRTIGNTLNDYADAWDVLNFVPGAGPILAPAMKTFSKRSGSKLSKVKPLEDAKNEIEKVLIDKGGKIVVIIDDIDRLNNSQIRSIFQLIKQVGSFPNTTYILPMDRDIVVGALNKVQESDGNVYLEKIVQIPFVIPELNRMKMQEIFLDKLNSLLKSKKVKSVNQKYWNNVFVNCVWPFIKNLRDINRVINTLEFKIDFLLGEICIEDFIALTTIDVLQPLVFEWIARNRSILCEDAIDNYYTKRKDAKEKRDEYEKELKEDGIPDTDKVIKAIATLFPHFSHEIDEYIFDEFEINLKRDMRIADIRRADLYFRLNKYDAPIPRSIIMDSLNSYSEADYAQFIDKTIEQ